jgi:hypothetical protein
MIEEDPIIELVRSGYYPETLHLSELVNKGYNLSFSNNTSRLYLRKGNEAIIVPIGLEWLAINYYNLKKTAEKIKVRVFLSYPREDLWFAYKLHKMLSEAGIPVYLAELSPEPGVTLWEKIRSMILSSDIVIVLWTKSAINRAFVNQEIGVASAVEKIIIPVVEEGVETHGALAGKEYIRFNRESTADSVSSICAVLHKFLSKKLEIIQQQQAQAQNFATAIGVILLLAALFAITNKK